MDPRSRILRQTQDIGGLGANGGGSTYNPAGGGTTVDTSGTFQLGGTGKLPEGQQPILVGNTWLLQSRDKDGKVTYLQNDGKTFGPIGTAMSLAGKTDGTLEKIQGAGGETIIAKVDPNGKVVSSTTIGGKSADQIKADLAHTTAETAQANANAAAAPIHAQAAATSAGAAASNAASTAARVPAQNAKDLAGAGKDTTDAAKGALDVHAQLVGQANNAFEQAYRGIMGNPNLSDAEKSQMVEAAKQQLLSQLKTGLDAAAQQKAQNDAATQAVNAFRDASTQADSRYQTASTMTSGLLGDAGKSNVRDSGAAGNYGLAIANMYNNALQNGAGPVAQTPFLQSLMNGGQSGGSSNPQMGQTAPLALSAAGPTGPPDPNAVAPNGMYGGGAPGGGPSPQVVQAATQAATQALVQKGVPIQHAQAIVAQHFGGMPDARGMTEPGTMDQPQFLPSLASVPPQAYQSGSTATPAANELGGFFNP